MRLSLLLNWLHFDQGLELLVEAPAQQSQCRLLQLLEAPPGGPTHCQEVKGGHPGQGRPRTGQKREGGVLPGPVGDALVVAHAREGDGGVQGDPPAREQGIEQRVQLLADEEGLLVHQIPHLLNRGLRK